MFTDVIHFLCCFRITVFSLCFVSCCFSLFSCCLGIFLCFLEGENLTPRPPRQTLFVIPKVYTMKNHLSSVWLKKLNLFILPDIRPFVAYPYKLSLNLISLEYGAVMLKIWPYLGQNKTGHLSAPSFSVILIIFPVSVRNKHRCTHNVDKLNLSFYVYLAVSVFCYNIY